MTKNRGSEYAKRISKVKEEQDELYAQYGLEMKFSGCWGFLSKTEQDIIGANARSAWQDADLKDNATGRKCGRACVVTERYVPAPIGPGYWHREYHDRNSGSVKHSLANHCRECCTRNGVPPDAVEGPGTERPYGSYGDDFPACE